LFVAGNLFIVNVCECAGTGDSRMPGADLTLHLYEEIAELYQLSGDADQRDVFLVLAADAAFNSGYPDIAEQIRLRLLTQNPYHLFRPYSSFTEALQSADIQSYIEDLVRRFPPATARTLLADLKDKEAAVAAREELFGLGNGGDASDLRVFQQFDDSLPAAPPTPRPAQATEQARRIPTVKPGLPISLAPPAPWLRQDSEPIADAGVDQQEMIGNWIALGLFVLALIVAGVMFGYTFIVPLLH